MFTKIKNTLLGLTLFSVINSCSYSEDTGRATYSGYVAFDYSCETVKEYVVLLKYIYQFNEYYSQPTASARDSVDRLYFSDIKIIQEENADIWTLKNIGYHYSNHHIMQINTNGHTLGMPDATWTITRTNLADGDNDKKKVTFTIKNKGEEGLHIGQHDNYNTDFTYTSEWNVSFQNDGRECYVTGNCTMLSILKPQLKLEYTITEPLKILLLENHHQELGYGSFRIFATDMKRNTREETLATVTPPYDIFISYQNDDEYWFYSLNWWD